MAKRTGKKIICSGRNNKWCKDFHDSGDGKCVHRKPHIENYTCSIYKCLTTGCKVKCGVI